MTQLFTGKSNIVNNTFQAESKKGKLKGLRVPMTENLFEKTLLKDYILTTYFKNTLILQNLLCVQSKRPFMVLM